RRPGADELAEDRTCQGVAEDGVTADARRPRRPLAAVGRREDEPDLLALVQVFPRLNRLPAWGLAAGPSDRTSEKNDDQGDQAPESVLRPCHGSSPRNRALLPERLSRGIRCHRRHPRRRRPPRRGGQPRPNDGRFLISPPDAYPTRIKPSAAGTPPRTPAPGSRTRWP